jgi:hypothetical protein
MGLEKANGWIVKVAVLGGKPPFSRRIAGIWGGDGIGYRTAHAAGWSGGFKDARLSAERPRARTGSGEVYWRETERPARRFDGSDHNEAVGISDWGPEAWFGGPKNSSPRRQAPRPRNQVIKLEEYCAIVSRCLDMPCGERMSKYFQRKFSSFSEIIPSRGSAIARSVSSSQI